MRDYAEILEDYKDNLSTKTLDQLKSEVTAKLKNDNLPFSHIVIAVEDLDRLDHEEIRSMVQLMRMVADFPRVIYLVGYDRLHVVNALGQTMKGSVASPEVHENVLQYGEGYLQKIVHASYKIPKPQDNAVSDFVFDKYYEKVAAIYGDDFIYSSHWQKTRNLLSRLINTIRVGERIMNRSAHMVLMLDKRSDPADILVSAYLMEYHPELWDWLWDNRYALLGGGRKFNQLDTITASFDANIPRQQNDDYIQRYIKGNGEFKEQVTYLLLETFPSLKHDTAHQADLKEREQYRIGSLDYFEDYFRYEHSSAAEAPDVVRILLNSDDSKSRNEAIQKINVYGYTMLQYVVRDLREYNKNEPIDWYSKGLPILQTLGCNFDQFENSISILRLAVEFINSLPVTSRETAVFDLLSRWINNNARFLTMKLVLKIGIENNFIQHIEKLPNTNTALSISFSKENFEKLKRQIQIKIQSWVIEEGNKRLLRHRHAASILSTWLCLDQDQANSFLETWQKHDAQMLELLNSMVSINISSGVNTKEGFITKRELNLQAVKEILKMDSSAIKVRVKEIQGKSEFLDQEYSHIFRAVEELPN